MNLFNRKSAIAPPSPNPLRASTSGPEAFATNSAYGRGFFEPGAYSVALKRCENGHDLAQQLADMFDERAQLELSYTNQLRAWSRKWHSELVKSQEYGTNKVVWDQTVTAGEQMADVHGSLSTSLTDSLIPKLRQWRKDNYEKSLIHYKKTKEFEKEFLDAQKSWSKLLEKIAEAKSAYYSASKAVKTAHESERNANNDEQRRKFADKAEVAKREAESAKTKYAQMINEAGEQRPRYVAAMKEVFERTQAFEKKRLEFFKETFEEYAKLLEAATNTNVILEKMNNDYKTTLNTHNAEQDLAWWDQNYGTETNSRWPEYEEYRD